MPVCVYVHVCGMCMTPPDISAIRWVHIGCNLDNTIVDIIHHICAIDTSDVVQQKGIKLGYPAPKVDGDRGDSVSGHKLRCCDCHLHIVNKQWSLVVVHSG